MEEDKEYSRPVFQPYDPAWLLFLAMALNYCSRAAKYSDFSDISEYILIP